MIDPELGELSNLSRAELEPVLWSLEADDAARADMIRAELAGRVWQGTNPYAPGAARR